MRTLIVPALVAALIAVGGPGVGPAADSKTPAFDTVLAAAKKQKKLVVVSVHQDA